MNIIELAFRLAAMIGRYSEQARLFFYSVVLSDLACPDCGGALRMVRESLCRCGECGCTLDPTVAFQRCLTCGGKPQLVVRRYRCRRCRGDVRSRFVFDGLVFDAAYFRERMAEHRERKQQQRDQVQTMLAQCRSLPADTGAIDLGAVSGLAEALNSLTSSAPDTEIEVGRSRFELRRYQNHIRQYLDDPPVAFNDIPPLGKDGRLDRIWRFIAIIFMDHAGLLRVDQRGQQLWVMPCETDGEGQGVSGEIEDVDGVEGSLCKVAAW